MAKPMVREHNVQTNEVIDREMTDVEFAQWKKEQEETAVKEAELAAKEAARQALLNKLGITAEEAKLLLS